MYVDLNAMQLPNVAGKDIFCLIINFKSHKIAFSGTGSSQSYLLQDHTDTCNSALGTEKGRDCGGLIQLNNWQIPDAYPW